MNFHGAYTLILLALAYSVSCIKPTGSPSRIILTHVIFRHGTRTPNFVYPTDPYINNTFYPIGRGALTNRGKQMMFRLGEILRNRYSKLLGEYYTDEKMSITTASSSRAKMSTQLVLAGLWPPIKLVKWSKKIDWQPILIEMERPDEDDVLNSRECKLKDRLLNELDLNSPESEFVKSNKDVIEYLEGNSGMKIRTPKDALLLYVALASEHEYGLKLPDWTRQVFPKQLECLSSETAEHQNANPILESIQAGYLIKKILNDTFNKINKVESNTRRVMHLYSTQQCTVSLLLNALKVLKKVTPRFGSTAVLEVHEQNNKYFIQVKYLLDPFHTDFVTLKIPNCGSGLLCPVDQFASLYDNIIPKESYQVICNRLE